MRDGSGRGVVVRAIVLAVMAIVLLVGAVALTFIASDLQLQLNDYYSQGVPPQNITQQELNTLSTLAYSLTNFVPPLLTAGVVAALGALFVLAVWWQRREDQAVGTDSVHVDSDEPAPASTA
ncbi:hypothetical protein BH11ACT3_BH11ACT3_01160 [soil metagenome]